MVVVHCKQTQKSEYLAHCHIWKIGNNRVLFGWLRPELGTLFLHEISQQISDLVFSVVLYLVTITVHYHFLFNCAPSQNNCSLSSGVLINTVANVPMAIHLFLIHIVINMVQWIWLLEIHAICFLYCRWLRLWYGYCKWLCLYLLFSLPHLLIFLEKKHLDILYFRPQWIINPWLTLVHVGH